MQITAIFGPTASGKSSLALKLCDKESLLVSFDSRKAYKRLDIGTNKLKLLKNIDRCTILGVNVFDPTERFTVYDFRLKIYKALITNKNNYKNLIFFGGSGLFLDSIVFGLNLGNTSSLKLREKLDKLPINQLQEKLKKIDIDLFNRLNNSDRFNKYRLIRQIEKNITLSTDKNMQDLFNEVRNIFEHKDIKLYLMIKEDKESLYEKIDFRVKQMFKDGWIEEVYNLINEYKISNLDTDEILKQLPALGIMGYKEIVSFIVNKTTSNKVNLHSLIVKIQRLHKNYAKLQITWAKRYFKLIKDLDNYYPQRNFSPNITIEVL